MKGNRKKRNGKKDGLTRGRRGKGEKKEVLELNHSGGVANRGKKTKGGARRPCS